MKRNLLSRPCKIASLAILLVINVYGQSKKAPIDNYLEIIPAKIKVKTDVKQEYKVVLKWQNLDAINGNKLNCNAVKATFTCGLDSGFVHWNNVSLSTINDFQQPVGKGTELPSFNNFSYKALGTDFLKETLYKDISAEHRDLAKWLVSDAIQMQSLASYVFDSLRFNKEFKPRLLDNFDIQFENWVKFSSRYQKLIWSGITKFNNEVCAIVKFESLYNPLEMKTPDMNFKGRSLYWGEIWVSLEDKQVEYATMVEDVIFELNLNNNPKQLLDLQREVTFTKN
jgi:hypothetical protein